jgi:hypothetical protein
MINVKVVHTALETSLTDMHVLILQFLVKNAIGLMIVAKMELTVMELSLTDTFVLILQF